MKYNILLCAGIAGFALAGCLSENEKAEHSEDTTAVKIDAPLEAKAQPEVVPMVKPIVVDATVQVYPTVTRQVKGISEVDRKRYFAICDPGVWFEKNVKDKEMYNYLVNDLGINFGRTLGPVNGAVKWDKAVTEDPNRPGYADLDTLKKAYVGKVVEFSEQYKKDFGSNLNVAAHDNHNAYPEFMGKYTTEYSKKGNHGKGEYLPQNLDAAAELAAAVFKYSYNYFARPRYFEPLNEPHWDFHKKQHIADWHLKTKKAVQKLCPEVKVGGYCSPVSYFFKNNYGSWKPFQTFMENTKGELDFYSFHTYDYLGVQEDGTIKGRIQSGLPLEGTLDMVSSYTHNNFGTEKPIVVSEHGGYIGTQPKGRYDGDTATDPIAAKHFPKKDHKGDLFEWEMKKRSIVDFIHVSSILTNTMTFLDHPHVVEKAVPFILFKTWGWSKTYYANLYVPYNYEDTTKWVPTQMFNFYKFFRDVKGRRVKLLCADPDLQATAFVDGKKLFVAINNLSNQPESFLLSGITGKMSIRRFGRNVDYTAYYKEDVITDADALTLSGREAVMIIAESDSEIKEASIVNEIPCYGDAVNVQAKDGEAVTFTVKAPVGKKIDYAVLRVAVAQKFGDSKGIEIALNGKKLTAPLEDSAERYLELKEKKNDFATVKFVRLDPADLQAVNKVSITFKNGDKKISAVGSVVIRAGVIE